MGSFSKCFRGSKVSGLAPSFFCQNMVDWLAMISNPLEIITLMPSRIYCEIWKARNKDFFNGVILSVDQVIFQINSWLFDISRVNPFTLASGSIPLSIATSFPPKHRVLTSLCMDSASKEVLQSQCRWHSNWKPGPSRGEGIFRDNYKVSIFGYSVF
ncbi:hypothetical protein ACH5RR_029602 [Cinchona calisaya]|uniref:Uncharacterized protein n=1 Tax=Cinchona calisaya TaxID=153742 RepID=A0ABD2YS38_9GENT